MSDRSHTPLSPRSAVLCLPHVRMAFNTPAEGYLVHLGETPRGVTKQPLERVGQCKNYSSYTVYAFVLEVYRSDNLHKVRGVICLKSTMKCICVCRGEEGGYGKVNPEQQLSV